MPRNNDKDSFAHYMETGEVPLDAAAFKSRQTPGDSGGGGAGAISDRLPPLSGYDNARSDAGNEIADALANQGIDELDT